MSQLLQIHPERCTGCMQCELACSWVQTGTFQPSQSLIRVNVFDEEASYAPFTCLQCAEAWCMSVCPVNAITLSDGGAKVVVDASCIGCHLCTIACPFGTIWTQPADDHATKCNLCGGDPACVTSCPTGRDRIHLGPHHRFLARFLGTACGPELPQLRDAQALMQRPGRYDWIIKETPRWQAGPANCCE